MSGTPSPARASLPELLYYLAVFHRAFTVMEKHPGPVWMILGGVFLDALHNTPGRLRRYDESDLHSPPRRLSYLQSLPQLARSRYAPKRVVADCEWIVSPEAVADDLGLSPDLSDIRLAPPDRMDRYLDRIYLACLLMRTRNHDYGRVKIIGIPVPTYMLPASTFCPWRTSTRERAVWFTQMAGAMRPIPRGLVRWDTFSEEQWLEAALNREARLAHRLRDSWRNNLLADVH